MLSEDKIIYYNKLFKDQSKQFDEYFTTFVNQIEAKLLENSEIKEQVDWFMESIKYNAFDGKKVRGLSVVVGYELIRMANNLEYSQKRATQAAALGWAVELLQSFFLVADDIMDNSITRRGKPCWYRKPDVGTIAINDSFFLESAVFILLEDYFAGEPNYQRLFHLFHKTILKTVIGQQMDLMTPINWAKAKEAGKDVREVYTDTQYWSIVRWKTSYYTFVLPIFLALHVGELHYLETGQNGLFLSDEFNLRLEQVMAKIGEIFQSQDDYLDCFSSPQVLGKIGTDIEDCKCSWLVVQALKQATPKQLEVFLSKYGCPQSTECIKKIYSELRLDELYSRFETESFAELTNDISELLQSNKGSLILPPEMFYSCLGVIYKRQK